MTVVVIRVIIAVAAAAAAVGGVVADANIAHVADVVVVVGLLKNKLVNGFLQDLNKIICAWRGACGERSKTMARQFDANEATFRFHQCTNIAPVVC